jgi:hypothetical protein
MTPNILIDLVPDEGIEPPTFGLQNLGSIQQIQAIPLATP